MEVYGFSSNVAALGRMMVYSVAEAVVVGTLSAAQRSLASFLMMTGSLPKDIDVLPKLPGIDKRFPIDELHRRKHPGPENKDASDTEDDDEDEDDAQGEEDDEGDEDFSGEEGGDDDDDDEEGDPEENPKANGNGGSDDEDEDDEDGDEDDEGDEDEDEEDEDEDEEDQPPAKKRK